MQEEELPINLLGIIVISFNVENNIGAQAPFYFTQIYIFADNKSQI